MKKNSLSTAIFAGVIGVAGLAGVSHAVNLNPDGLGQVLVYPYYTVNGGNSTVISVVNTTDQVKAVKVRFVEALNSAEVYDFNLYLSPYDVWATNVVADGETGAKLVTLDNSCTVPNQLPGSFLIWEFAANSYDANRFLWGSEAQAKRVRQGHLEIIEMGNILPGDGSLVLGGSSEGKDISLARAATHVNGVPRDCGALQIAWDVYEGGVWNFETGDTGYGISSPSGGLFGGATIISAEMGRTLSYNAEAIDGFYTIPGGNLHYDPGSVFPYLGNAATRPASGTLPAVADARIFANGNYYEFSYVSGFDAVSATFMARYIYNEYSVNPGLDAASEWVVTFPTKRGYVHRKGDPYLTGGQARLPFRNSYPWLYDPDYSDYAVARSCHAYQFKYWDREERTTTRQLTVSPPAPTSSFSLCYEANIIAFGQTISNTTPTRILGATASYGAVGLSGFEFPEGWARLELNGSASAMNYYLPHALDPTTRDPINNVLIGQPVTGFWASEVVNNNVADGIRANYGVIHKHRASRECRVHLGNVGDAVAATASTCF